MLIHLWQSPPEADRSHFDIPSQEESAEWHPWEKRAEDEVSSDEEREVDEEGEDESSVTEYPVESAPGFGERGWGGGVGSGATKGRPAVGGR